MKKRRKGNGNTAFVVTFFTGVFNRLRDSNSFSLGFFRGESAEQGLAKLLQADAGGRNGSKTVDVER